MPDGPHRHTPGILSKLGTTTLFRYIHEALDVLAVVAPSLQQTMAVTCHQPRQGVLVLIFAGRRQVERAQCTTGSLLRAGRGAHPFGNALSSGLSSPVVANGAEVTHEEERYSADQRKRRDSNPRTLAGLSLSRRPGARVGSRLPWKNVRRCSRTFSHSTMGCGQGCGRLPAIRTAFREGVSLRSASRGLHLPRLASPPTSGNAS